MKKVILLLSLLLLFLVSCSKITINAKMYQLENFKYSKKIDDYEYEILDTYNDYESNLNKSNMNEYDKVFFDSSSLIIIYLKEPSSNKYELKEASIINNNLKITVNKVLDGLTLGMTTVSYCIEVESKNISMVEVNRVKMNQE